MLDSDIKDKVKHWCDVLGIAEMPSFLVRDRSYYWNKTCVFNASSENIDHDIVHELVHFKDDLRFDIELLSEFSSILKLGLIIGAVIILFVNVPFGAFIIILCAVMKAIKELVTEGRAEYYAIRLAGGRGRMVPFLSVVFLNSAILAGSVPLSVLIFLGVESRMDVIIVTCAATSLAVLSIFSDRLLLYH
jgi:hypothetical protein